MGSVWLAQAAPAAPLSVGDQAPRFTFTDIQGKRAATHDYRDGILVFTFADRHSNDPLMDWIMRAGETVAAKHPHLKISYINFADVSSVPSFLRPIVKPVIRSRDEKVAKRTRDSYLSAGIVDFSGRFAFHLIPDWEGVYLRIFGIPDAARYRVWVVYRDRVVADLDGSHPDPEASFQRVFEEPPIATAPQPATGPTP